MKTPDEIKKGLECGFCHECPYDSNEFETVEECARQVHKDALAYIQQLETERHQMLTKCEQLERERDAAVADLESVEEKYKTLKSMIDDVTFNHEPNRLYLDCRSAADATVEHEHADVRRVVCEENSK